MTLYVVLNEDGREGFVTDDHEDAQHAAGHVKTGSPYSTLGDRFRELYYEADILEIQEISILNPKMTGLGLPSLADVDPENFKSQAAKEFVEHELREEFNDAQPCPAVNQVEIEKINKYLARPCVRLSPTRNYNPYRDSNKPWGLFALDGKIAGFGETLEAAENNFDTAFNTFDVNCRMHGVDKAFKDLSLNK